MAIKKQALENILNDISFKKLQVFRPNTEKFLDESDLEASELENIFNQIYDVYNLKLNRLKKHLTEGTIK
jgi:hypothetical protein